MEPTSQEDIACECVSTWEQLSIYDKNKPETIHNLTEHKQV